MGSGDGLGIGLLGLGRHGRRYAAHLLAGDIPGVRLACFWRRDRAQAAADAAVLGVRAEPTVESLIEARDVDAVAAVVPAALHPEIAERCAALGRPLLLEKPLAVSIEAGRRITSAAERTPVMIAHTLRFDPLLARLLAERPRFGRLVGFGFEQRLEPRGLAWELDPTLAGGGVLIQTGIHTVDALRVLTRAEAVRVLWARLDHLRGAATEDQAQLALEVRGPEGTVIGDLRCSKISGSRQHRFNLLFEDGALEADFVARAIIETRGRTQQHTSVPEAPTIAAALATFARWLAGPKAPSPVPATEALAALEVVAEAQRIGGRST
jgi:predicted dehydrogenase